MEPEEKNISHLESLHVIADAISRTKDNFRENSFYFLLWGWLITAASVAFFILQQYTTVHIFFVPFPIAAATGGIVTIVRYLKHRSVAPTESYITYFLSRLWMVLGLNFVAVVFINVSQNQQPFTYTLILAGIGTFVSGLVMKFRPMTVGGIVCLISAMVIVYVPQDYRVLLHGAAVVSGYLVPGYLLKASNK
ncbi:hypothetical protein KK083_14265 [Fulvivirgaceae bacterium PWU4]|uniref:Uncharacterized protein n=1 Tax=Chryseosolibacter histidini TaxID=2782349 RepID=A0AAP2DMN7_9BACT|nr:hypothetical protein [Chryseosolibacter histidini]MBT1698053.1 hypothetical protein [Chryseosolibacter histidini]